MFLEDGGDDRYEGMANLCTGASAQNGLSLFFERGGRDAYRIPPGKAGPNNYHGGHSLALFIDAGSEGDAYRVGLRDGQAKIEDVAGVQIDTPGALEALEALSDEGLRTLLGR